MFSRFFIDRPIFASVLSILITLAGGIALFTLPIAQFPAVAPPNVSVTCNYPGASAQDVADAVAVPIEQQVNGVEGMLYMSSSCTNDGGYNLTVTFRQGVDLDMAQVLVQNRVALAVPLLPDVIKQTGVSVRKRAPDILMGFAVTSPDGRYDQLYLSNYVLCQVKDDISRVDGVADVILFGQRDYSMRIWVDPGRLAARNLTAMDVAAAVRQENTQVATGQIGQQPVPEGQPLQVPLTTLGRLSEVEQFENIIVRATPDGRLVRLKDVARVELGARSQDMICRFNGRETAFLAVFQTPDANALDVRDRVVAKMDELQQSFPDGVTYQIAFDTTPYTRESIAEVFKTLRDAIILVALVVLLFLQEWRSALIPLLAVPVAIVGTFAVMAGLGFSLNNLTLFGLVLAIGIVVDDAIVVVEAVQHHIEQGLAPRAATIVAMQQVSGPVIAVGLVLSAVFVPCAFIGGITGQFFRQFALTIAVSTLISAFNSLTLSPALCALLLRPHHVHQARPQVLPRLVIVLLGGWLGAAYLTPWLERVADRLPAEAAVPDLAYYTALAIGAAAGWLACVPLNLLLSRLFRAFNVAFEKTTLFYTRLVGLSLRLSVLVLLSYAGMVGLTGWAFEKTPKGFIPGQDMGYLLISVQLPDSASLERTLGVMKQIEQLAKTVPGVRHVTTISGQSFVLNAAASNFGSVFINLHDYHNRRTAETTGEAVAARLRREFGEKIFDAMVAVFPPAPVRGVGRAGGFTLMVEDRSGDAGPHALQAETDHLIRNIMSKPGISGVFSVFRANIPQIRIEPSWSAATKKGVRLEDFASTLRIYEGSLYVNDFNRFGRTWQVIIQADASHRDEVTDLGQLKVRNQQGQMVPVGSIAQIHEVNGPLVLTRYNMYPAASVNGTAAPGISSGDVMAMIQGLADDTLGPSMAYEWTDMSYLELMAGRTGLIIFGFAVVMVFLVLAAQYESWSLPLAVILVVPLCLLCSIAGVNLAAMDINVFTQIGFVVLVGLASKNAILIVEFAKKQREAGVPRYEATLEACRLRLRPIIMTSLAFILGVVPLVVAQGAGMEMRRTLGTAVFSGMLGVTLFGILLTPVFFYVIDYLSTLHLFASRPVRRVAEVTARLISLGYLWQLLRWLGRRLRARSAPAVVGRNGTARPHAEASRKDPAIAEPPVPHSLHVHPRSAEDPSRPAR